jgi:pre-mRNA-splicing factor SYF1
MMEILQNQFNLISWWNHIHSFSDNDYVTRFQHYEKALTLLPRSYKLWFAYLLERSAHLSILIIPGNDKKYDLLFHTFERSLIYLSQMPRLWIDYATVLLKCGRFSRFRSVFDRCLQSLPLTQHSKIWMVIIPLMKKFLPVRLLLHFFRRYLCLNPSFREDDYIPYLKSLGYCYDEVAHELLQLLKENSTSNELTPVVSHNYWMELCEIFANHALTFQKTTNFGRKTLIDVEAVIRDALTRFPDEAGRLWNYLAEFYIRCGKFDEASSVYEEAMNSVIFVRDFTLVFDSLIKIEESIVTAKMKFLEEAEVETADEDGDGLHEEEKSEHMNDINLRLSKIENFMEKRPLLLNNVLIRQNPNNVAQWKKRFRLLSNNQENLQLAVFAFAEAVKTIDPSHAVGKFSQIWIIWSRFYEKHGDVGNAKNVFAQAVPVPFKSVDELAEVYCAWVEFEIRQKNYEEALQIVRSALEKTRAKKSSPLHDRLQKNVRLWNLYLDLEESLSPIEVVRSAYENAYEIKIITVSMVLNYASYLENCHYYEDAFKVYERSVSLFEFPAVKIIWLIYLDKFAERYGSSKLIRLEDLFEEVLRVVPLEDSVEFFMKYITFEEKYGSPKNVLKIFERACKVLPDRYKLSMYRLYIKKVEEYYGAIHTRKVYTEALKLLSDDNARQLCVEYFRLERNLGEIDRARAILQYGSQFADPKRFADFWSNWRLFEQQFGNEDTFKDMLRIQRSVEAALSQVFFIALLNVSLFFLFILCRLIMLFMILKL